MITICFIENIDPLGVHTGDSFCSAPMLTISKEVQDRLQEQAYRIVESIGVIGGTNVQFAHDPVTDRIVVIEINPRTSRSSALASKATGFPIALVSAMLAAGLTLDEIPCGKYGTLDKYYPDGDYVVIKFARWAFEKFKAAEDKLGTQMKAVGEVMSIGKTYKEAFQKAIRSLETGRYGLGYAKNFNDLSKDELLKLLINPTSERQFIMYEALRKGATVNELFELTKIKHYFIEQMKELFGEEVAMLIDGVTKLSKMKYKSKEDQQLETYRKMFLAMAKDIRVIMIKLADRLHNMRTLKYMREEKQKRIAKETLEVYAPLANRLGISNIKWELEDLCLRYLEPETYYDLVDKVNQKREERQGFINDAVAKIQQEFDKIHLKGEIKGRAKHFYSIYRKMKKSNKDISDIFDLLAVRVLVQTIPDCYTVLGIIHAMWKPLPGRFKDYIAVPKTNGYQSLHTTVITDNGLPLEIQIRTFAMHAISEYGIAAHWKYKEAGNKSIGANSEYDKKLSWLRQMITLQDEFSDPREYFEALKLIFSPMKYSYILLAVMLSIYQKAQTL